MRINVNGESVDIPDGATLLECLEQRGLNPALVVVERNRHIVPAGTFAEVRLAPGDVLEILHFVGGG